MEHKVFKVVPEKREGVRAVCKALMTSENLSGLFQKHRSTFEAGVGGEYRKKWLCWRSSIIFYFLKELNLVTLKKSLSHGSIKWLLTY